MHKPLRQIVRASTRYALQLKVKDKEQRGWRQIGEMKCEGFYYGAFAILMELQYGGDCYESN